MLTWVRGINLTELAKEPGEGIFLIQVVNEKKYNLIRKAQEKYMKEHKIVRDLTDNSGLCNKFFVIKRVRHEYGAYGGYFNTILNGKGIQTKIINKYFAEEYAREHYPEYFL